MSALDPQRDAIGHVPVLGDQVLALLDPRPGQVLLDCTVGRGGHSALIAPRLAPGGRVIGLDVDPGNVAFARQRLAAPRSAPIQVDIHQSNFVAARTVLDSLGVPHVDLLLADLGFSSTQMDDPERGFSFMNPGPLDMRLDPALTTTAADLVNRLPERELADLIYRFGEERLSRRIARKIVEVRRKEPINNTEALARIVRESYGSKAHQSRIHPATRTFMALRIAVNDELEALTQLLSELPRLVGTGGVAAIISFHSLEDRLVKNAFRAFASAGQGEVLTRKPVTAGDDECLHNPRSRSAKLRAMRFNDTRT